MKISINKGFKQNYPVYLKEFDRKEQIPNKNIQFTQNHFIITTKEGYIKYFDINGNTNISKDTKLYCKIPFYLSNLFEIILCILVWALMLTSVELTHSNFSIVSIIMIYVVYLGFVYLWDELRSMKLKQYIEDSKHD